jgi:hypothetical protein
MTRRGAMRVVMGGCGGREPKVLKINVPDQFAQRGKTLTAVTPTANKGRCRRGGN